MPPSLLMRSALWWWMERWALQARVLPHQRTSKKAILVANLAPGFLASILAGAQKLTQAAHPKRE